MNFYSGSTFSKVACGISCQFNKWYIEFQNTVDDLLFKSNVHSCTRNLNKNGTRKKGKALGCMDNKWGKCKARFPREIWPATVIDSETEGITMKKEEA